MHIYSYMHVLYVYARICMHISKQLQKQKNKHAYTYIHVHICIYVYTSIRTDTVLRTAPSPGCRCSVVSKIAVALQRAAGARLYKLPPVSAVRSRRPDLIELGDWPALVMPRKKLAVARSESAETGAGACEREATVTSP